MRIKILILLLFAAFGAQGQTIIPLAGNTRDTVRVKGNLRTDSSMRCLGLINLNGDDYKLTTDATGKLILRPDLGGSASTDDQQLTISNDTIFLEDGGYVVLPASGVTIDTTSLSNRINQRVKYTDTAAMLTNYINAVTYGLIKTGQSIRADTSQLVTQYDLTQLVDNNTTYTAGFGLDLNGTQFLVDTGEIRTVANSYSKAQFISILADTADAIRDDFPAVLNNPDSTLPGWGLLENNNTIYVDTGAGKVATAYDVSLKVNYTDTGAMLLPYITENEVLAIIDDTAAAIRADIPDVTGFGTQQALEDTAAAIRADFPTFSVPTLEQVLNAGNSDTLGTITLYDGAVSARLHQWSNTTNTHIVSVSAPSTTASRNIQWPDANGTALLNSNQATVTLKNYSNPVVSNLPTSAAPVKVLVLDGTLDTVKVADFPTGGVSTAWGDLTGVPQPIQDIEDITYDPEDFLMSDGTNIIDQTPSQVKVTLGLNNVENTALSTWAGTTNITTLGTIATGVWSGTAIATNKGGTGLTSIGTANQVLGVNNGASGLEYKSFAVGTSGTDFAVAHSANTLTFNLPTASASNRGALSSSDWSTFNGKVNTGSITGSGLTMNTAKLLGRTTASSGAVEEITVNSPLTLTAGALDITAIPISDLNITGTPDGTKFLKDDGSWAVPSGGGGVSDGDKGDITVSSSGATWNIDAATVGTTELSATGTPSSSTFLRGDNTWAAPTASVSNRTYRYVSSVINWKTTGATLLFTTEASMGRFIITRVYFSSTVVNSPSGNVIFRIGWTGANYFDFINNESINAGSFFNVGETYYSGIPSLGSVKASAPAGTGVYVNITTGAGGTSLSGYVIVEGHYQTN